MEESLKRQQSMFLILVLVQLNFLIEEIWGVGYPNRCAPPSPQTPPPTPSPPIIILHGNHLNKLLVPHATLFHWVSGIFCFPGLCSSPFSPALILDSASDGVLIVSTMMLYRSTLVHPLNKFNVSMSNNQFIYLFVYLFSFEHHMLKIKYSMTF